MEVTTVRDFDRLMGDSLKAIRDDHVREIERQIPAVRQQIATKIRGRHFTFVIGGVAAAAAAVAVALFITQSVPNLDRSEPIRPAEPTVKPVVGDVPVWYDARGLHRGDVVEQTPVDIGVLGNTDYPRWALALVRSGAVYLDPVRGEVWFHPWGGEPRIVGHDSEWGPGGDPNGDTAAWFEGSPGGPVELVVYDTAAGREISRTSQAHDVGPVCCHHMPPGNAFLQVSLERVQWGYKPWSHDVRSRVTSVVKAPKNLWTQDVHDQIEVFFDNKDISYNHSHDGGRGDLVLRVPGRADERFPDMEVSSRLSPSGNYLLAVPAAESGQGAVIIDTRTGELWRVPRNVNPSSPDWSPSIAWSYGDIAMVDYTDISRGDHTEGELLACDAARRTCERLPAERPFLMPTN